MSKEQTLREHLGDYFSELDDASLLGPSINLGSIRDGIKIVGEELLDYLDPVEQRDEDLVRLEELTHQVAITPWVEDHISTSKGLVRDTGYDPINKRWQRLDVGYTPAKSIPSLVPERIILRKIESKIAAALGSRALVYAMVDTYQNTPAYKGSSLSVSQEFERMLLEAEHFAIFGDHLEQGNLRDIALLAGGLILATGNADLREQLDVVLGKNIGRQEIGGKEVVPSITAGMGILWTVQNTGKRLLFDFPEGSVRVMASAFNHAVKQRQSEGGHAMAVVASGTTTPEIIDENGQKIYDRQDVSPTVGVLSKRIDAALSVAYSRGKILPGPFRYISDQDQNLRRSEQGEQLIYQSLADLAIGGAILTDTPVRYQRSATQIETAYPYPSAKAA